jgi:glutamate dehydrogenase (NAD(P)+)
MSHRKRAMSGVINDKTAPKLLEHGIKIIVEAANIPTTPTADEYLNKNGVWIIPDFLANAGGVIGSFVEYQGRIEKEAFELIDYKIAQNVKQILSDAMVQDDESIYDETQNPRK